MAPESRTESELTLPKDLLSEVQRHLPSRRGDFHVEGWKPLAGRTGCLGSWTGAARANDPKALRLVRMSAAHHRLSRPVYEGLPWAYLLGGLLALIASYFQTSSTLEPGAGPAGLARCCMAGVGGAAADGGAIGVCAPSTTPRMRWMRPQRPRCPPRHATPDDRTPGPTWSGSRPGQPGSRWRLVIRRSTSRSRSAAAIRHRPIQRGHLRRDRPLIHRAPRARRSSTYMISCLPITTMSPSLRLWRRTRLPCTKMPLVLLRSSIMLPSAPVMIWQ